MDPNINQVIVQQAVGRVAAAVDPRAPARPVRRRRFSRPRWTARVLSRPAVRAA
jgi:hypothetical protein